MFSGSYEPEDVTFLLKPIQIAFTPVAEKERLIQSGARHYSEMLSREQLPSSTYLRVFHEGLAQQKERFARDLIILASRLATARPKTLTLVSLARAGTPIGVLLGRIFREHLRRPVAHYSLSIIRDRGIDEAALRYILQRHPADSLVFVDGWTGKGVIGRELHRAITHFNERYDTALDAGLYTVADLSGTAADAATDEDYLIPSCVLGCTIGGLVSRSILHTAILAPGDFHGCVYYSDYASHDLSRWFIDTMSEAVARQRELIGSLPAAEARPAPRARLRMQCAAFLEDMRRRYGVRDVNHVKPGIGEATRVLLRRVPDCLLLRNPALAQAAHLVVLAREKGVPTVIEPSLPYHAAALIKELEG